MAAHPPAIHPKNAMTGKGVTPKTPGNAGLGNSNHNPQTGSDYTLINQQQEKQDK